ncbi:DUF3302 domain-containing protein [Deefgea piscis]|uniref:DUF3302 domain-containing protein n=1 Tax=Deefgea piscis TaxID=2739061 RepID=A0A6M8SQE9_9NEIS|nr:DUF3302 domain-containing protein [Deefgea piscis]QKJ65526.1 DUF3302 domain-containing protein [Deefgea piscis]
MTPQGYLFTIAACLTSMPALAFAPGMEESIADVMVWVVIVAVPVAAIYLFWKVHVLPEVIAEKNHHPQKHAIQVLCLLSLVFGGLLWPLAWLWAFAKPTAYKIAYGTDKHDDFFKHAEHHADKSLDLAVVDEELTILKQKMDGLNQKRELILNQQTPTTIEQKAEGNKDA